MQAFLEHAIAQGREPQRTPSDSVILRGDGRTHRVLVNAGGEITPTGTAYEAQTGVTLPRGEFDASQSAEREGNVETIVVRGGRRRVVRTFDPAADNGAGKWRYTVLGRAFYRTKRISYLVRVPARFTGTNARGNAYARDGFFPFADPIPLPMTLTRVQRDARIRAAILRTIGPGGLIAEYSQEEIRLRRNVQWQVTEEVTSPGAGEPTTEVRDRPLGEGPVRISSLPFVEALTPAAFEVQPDRRCVARQLAQVTGLCAEEVTSMLDSLAQGWQRRGATSRNIFAFAKSIGRGACCLHGVRTVEVQPGPLPLVWTVWEGHCYMYTDPSVRRRLAKRLPHEPLERIKQPQRERADVVVPEPFAGAIVPGDFHAPEDDMDAIRELFLAEGRHPRVALKDAWRIKRLTYVFASEEHTGTCTIHAWPEDAPKIAAWLNALAVGVPYTGQGLATATHQVLLKLLKRSRERVFLEPEQRHELLERYNYTCALCGARGAALQMDHKIRLTQSFGPQDLDGFWPICVPCHTLKTSQEPQSYESDVLASSFNPHVWVTYVESPRPPPLVYHFEDAPEDLEGVLIADVIRCRKRSLEMSRHEIPVFCVYDDWRARTTPELGDVNWVVAPAWNVKEQLGYTGPGAQHRVQTEFLLEQGVIRWEDVTHTLTATGRLPPEVFQEPFRVVEEAWPTDWGRKECFNALTGLFCLDQSWRWTLVSSDFTADAPRSSLRRITQYPGGRVLDHISKIPLRNIASHRPVHDLCMCSEAAHIGRALAFLRAAGARVYELKTDSILFEDGGEERDVLAGLAHPTGDPVFRCNRAEPKDLMRSRGAMPRRDAGELCPANVTWRDLSEEEAARLVLAGGSLAIEGVAGTGKSTWVSALAVEIAASGRTLSAVSKTHCASSRVQGVTADHWVRRHVLNGACSADVLWLEEAFQTECTLMTQLAKLPSRVSFILTGDPHQFGPVHSHWRGCPVPAGAFERSSMYHAMAQGNRLRLTTCRRSDEALFAYYSSLIAGGARFELPLSQVLAEARERFRFEGPARHNLCISHKQRRRLNRDVSQALRPKGAVFLRANAATSESTWIWPGFPLIGATSCAKTRILNNVAYIVEEVRDEGAVVLEGDRKLTFQQVLTWLRPAWARTYASSQGTEFPADETLRLWDTRNPHFSMRHLYVAVSRAKDTAQIHVT